MDGRTKSGIFKKFKNNSALKTSQILNDFRNVSNKPARKNEIEISIGIKHSMTFEKGDK
jgi:hypothetical protein